MNAPDRLFARPHPPGQAGPAPGLHTLPLGGRRDSYLFVPAGALVRPSPLVLLLHGAGGHAHDGLRMLLHLADRAGLILVAPASSRPAVYISHGTRDPILAIDFCSRIIAPRLEAAGYALRYREFDGGHTIPPEVAQEAVDWLMEEVP
jgi:predicted esterase